MRRLSPWAMIAGGPSRGLTMDTTPELGAASLPPGSSHHPPSPSPFSYIDLSFPLLPTSSPPHGVESHTTGRTARNLSQATPTLPRGWVRVRKSGKSREFPSPSSSKSGTVAQVNLENKGSKVKSLISLPHTCTLNGTLIPGPHGSPALALRVQARSSTQPPVPGPPPRWLPGRE